MARHTREHLSQAIFGDAKSKTLLQNLGGLLKNNDFEPASHSFDIRSRSITCQSTLANDQHVVVRQFGVSGNGLKAYL